MVVCAEDAQDAVVLGQMWSWLRLVVATVFGFLFVVSWATPPLRQLSVQAQYEGAVGDQLVKPALVYCQQVVG